MTLAICFKCGNSKFGALVRCKSCGATPKAEIELARSLIMTDHHLGIEMLEQMASMIKSGIEPPIPDATITPFLNQAKAFSSSVMGQSILGANSPEAQGIKKKKWFWF
jgi:hypothetical protein